MAENKPAPGLARRSLINLGWLTSTQYVLMVAGFVVSVALARILTPLDFGTVALASSLGDIIFAMLTGWAFPLTVLQDQRRTSDLESSAFVLTGLLAIGTLGLSFIISMGLGSFYQDARIGTIFFLLAIANCLQLFAVYWGALLERDLDYGRHQSVNLAAQLLGLISSVVMAASGLGVWSLVFPMLIVNTGLLLGWGGMARFRASLRVTAAAVRRLFFMGARWLLSTSLEYAFTRFDNLAVGSFIGREQLGYYNRAYNTADLGFRASAPFSSTYPIALYAKLQQDRAKLSTAFHYLNVFIMTFSGLVALSWLALAGPIVSFLYGEKWLAAVPFLQALSLYAFMRPLVSHGTALVYAQGMPGKIARIKLVQLAVFVPALLLATALGVQYVPWVINLNQLIGLVLTLREARRLVDANWLRAWFVPLCAMPLTGAALWLLSPALSRLPLVFQIASGGFIILAGFGLGLLVFERPALQYGWQLLRSRAINPYGDR